MSAESQRSPEASQDGDTGRGSLLSQLRKFDKTQLHKTETTVTYADGISLVESKDDDGKTVVKHTSSGSYGFVPSVVADLQVGEILPGLIMGSQDVAADWDILDKYKVTHILNVATWVDNHFPKKIKYKNLKIMDTIDFHILPFFDVAFSFIDEGRKEGCVLVHCNAGVSRAATFTIGYLMKTEGKTFLEAFEHVKKKRPSTWPNPGFKVQLETYGERLRASQSKE